MADSARAPGVMIDLSQPASDGDGTSGPRAVVPDETTSAGPSAVRKPRGRPPGSKNKPKQPVVVTSALHPVVLQFDGGFDIVSGLSDYVRRHRVGVSVLFASGVVSGVSLRHAPLALGLPGVFTLKGRFDILSLSGTLFPPSAAALPPGHFFSGTLFPPGASPPPPLTVSLANSCGQVIGGAVMGSMPAAGPVLIMIATFARPEFLRLPISDDDNEVAVEEEEKEDDDSGADPVTPLATTSLPSTLIDVNVLPVRQSHTAGIELLAHPSSIRPPPHPRTPALRRPLLSPSDITTNSKLRTTSKKEMQILLSHFSL